MQKTLKVINFALTILLVIAGTMLLIISSPVSGVAYLLAIYFYYSFRHTKGASQ